MRNWDLANGSGAGHAQGDHDEAACGLCFTPSSPVARRGAATAGTVRGQLMPKVPEAQPPYVVAPEAAGVRHGCVPSAPEWLIRSRRARSHSRFVGRRAWSRHPSHMRRRRGSAAPH